ncbi:MAG: hypothetical protein [Olavius algarvensis Gamma 1 endosymbiont]|nr:MAG: hypothetical protein [Olavius algarvensis Gamma 1 endosymbiont]
MKITMATIGRLLVVGLLVTASSGAVFAGAEFSGEMLRHGPQGKRSSEKMFMGDKRVRTEATHQGRQIIRITDADRGVAWILFPDRKKYGEQKLGGPGDKLPGARATPAENPCNGLPGMTCRRLGEEEISGQTAVKWEMVASHQGQTMQSTQWIDKERGTPLRQEMPGGQIIEHKFIAMENLDGRRVEKWEMVATMPNQPEIRTFQWFDPELEITVRRELPGVMISELKNIRVGKQPGELFTIPADYERMTTPAGMPEGPPGRTIDRRP